MADLIRRRSFLTGLAAAFAAPAIVRATSLMPVRGIVMDLNEENVLKLAGDMLLPGQYVISREQVKMIGRGNIHKGYDILNDWVSIYRAGSAPGIYLNG